MAATTAALPITLLDDATHPRLAITIRNQSECLFFKMPPEIRIMIYTYAVVTDQPIHPSQAASRSNRFRPLNVDLDVVPLSQTCRQFYAEAVPIFYANSTFHFTSLHSLIVYLAAITPYRRTLVRSISLAAEFNGAATAKRARAMLSCCTSLRNLIVTFVSFSSWSHTQPQDDLSWHLQRLVRAVNAPADNCYLSTASNILFKLTWKEHTFEFPSNELSAGKDILSPDAILRLVRSEKSTPEDADSLLTTVLSYKKIRQHITTVCKALSEIEPQDPEVDGDELREVIASAGIDFPGEDRVGQSRIASDMWSISSRTRRKCNSEVNTLGVIQPAASSSRYTEDGILIEEFRRVVGVRWAEGPDTDSRIECELSFNPLGRPTAWEPLRVIAYQRGISLLCQFYEKLGRRFPRDSETVLTATMGIPAPKDIVQELRLYDQDASYIQKVSKRWARIHNNWTTYLTYHRTRARTQKEELEARRLRAELEAAQREADENIETDGGTRKTSSRSMGGVKVN